MIVSKGKNQFQDNKYSFWEWSAPVLQTPEEVMEKVKELKLEGRVIKDIVAVGFGYDIEECLEVSGSDKIQKKACVVTIDEPLLIEFEDGDVLGMNFSEGSCVRMELNTLPLTLQAGVNQKNFNANRLFSRCIGDRIMSVEVGVTTMFPEFTGSYGLDLDEEQPWFVSSVSFTLRPEWRSLNFHPYFDYGIVALKDSSGKKLCLCENEIKAVVEGF